MIDHVLNKIVNNTLPYQNIDGDNATVLIGYSNTGPIMLPMKADNIEKVSSIFELNSNLGNAYIEAAQSGASNIYLIRINGFERTINIQDKIILVSLEVFKEDFVQGLSISIEEKIEFTLSADGEAVEVVNKYLRFSNQSEFYEVSYLLNDTTIDSLVEKINMDAYLGIIPFYAKKISDGNSFDMALSLGEDYVLSLSTAQNSSITEGEFADRLEEILNNLASTPADNIGIINGEFSRPIIVDPANPEESSVFLYSILSEFADSRLSDCSPVHITIGIDDFSYLINDPESPAEVLHPYDMLVDLATVHKSAYTLSPFINFIATAFGVYGTHDRYVSNGVATYCGLLSDLGLNETTTNKALLNVEDLYIDLSDDQIKTLASYGFVVVVKSGRDFVINNGVNLLYADNSLGHKMQLSYVYNTNLIKRLVKDLDHSLENLIGRQTNDNEINYLIKKVFSTYEESIKSYSVQISKENEGFSTSYLIKIQLILYGEVEKITITVSKG